MENEALTTLDLSLNHITDQGIETILNYLESNRTLTKLDLSDNEIGNKGAKLILSFIEKVTFHVGTNKNIFLAENELHLGLSGLYETELPGLI